MDVKLGTSSNTKRAKKKGAEKLAKGDKKDAERTSALLGLTITGMKVDGETHVYKTSREI